MTHPCATHEDALTNLLLEGREKRRQAREQAETAVVHTTKGHLLAKLAVCAMGPGRMAWIP